MSVKEQYWKYSLITIILGLGLILFIKMSPFIGGILGACTIYIMVRKQMFYLTQEKHFKKSITAILRHYKIFCVNGKYGIPNRVPYFLFYTFTK